MPARISTSRTSLLFKQNLRNFATFTKIYWKTRFRKKVFVKGITCCHGNPFFDAMFSQILTFLIFFLLIHDFFKTIANSVSQSQEMDNFSQLINFKRDL